MIVSESRAVLRDLVREALVQAKIPFNQREIDAILDDQLTKNSSELSGSSWDLLTLRSYEPQAGEAAENADIDELKVTSVLGGIHIRHKPGELAAGPGGCPTA